MKIKNKIGGLTLLDFETYYIATVMNTVILVQGQKNQWNRIEFRTDSLFMVNRFLTKVLRMLVKKGNFFQQNTTFLIIIKIHICAIHIVIAMLAQS